MSMRSSFSRPRQLVPLLLLRKTRDWRENGRVFALWSKVPVGHPCGARRPIVARAEGLPGPDAQRGSTWQAVAFTFTFTESARPRIRPPRLPARCGQEVVMIRIVAAALVALALLAPRAVVAQDSDRSAMKSAPTAPVNLNTATTAQLESLPGIGARTAALIVEYRQKNGSFKKIEDLMNVRGVGEKSFLRLKPLITVTPPKTDRAAQQ